MVNKCSVSGCRSLYTKENVKLHRFPLSNQETLPLWIAATGRESEWKPCKSSRLCGNHFRESEYIIGHGKGILKSTAIPTIEYQVKIPRYNKRKYPNFQLYDLGHINKLIKVEQMAQETDINVEVVQLDYDDVYVSNQNNENKDNIDTTTTACSSYINCEKSYLTNESKNTQNNKEIIKKIHQVTPKLEITDDEKDDEDTLNINSDNSNSDTPKIEYEYENFQNDNIGKESQSYLFTSSFEEGIEPINFTSPDIKPSLEEPSIINVDQSIADSSFNKIMGLKLKKQRRTKDIYSMYFKTLIKKGTLRQDKSREKTIQSFNDDSASFAAFIETQMKELRPYKRLYLSTKHKIQKILMKAQLKIAN